MKKIKIVTMLFIVVFIVGCSNTSETKVSKGKIIYQNYVKHLTNITKSSDYDYPFDIEVKYDKITKNEVRYQVIIDNPKEKLTNISALAMHDKPTDDVFPSTGIFEKRQKLVPNKKPSGIILIGYIPFNKSEDKLKCTIKLLIRYSTKEKTQTVYYVTKKS